VIHCTGDPLVPVALRRYLGQAIPGARYVEVDADFHASWRVDDLARLGQPAAEFLAELGLRSPPPPAQRVLATVMFLDSVESTIHAT
jgi:hypothetical protein